VAACLLETRFVEAGFLGPSWVPWVPFGFLGFSGASRGFLGLAGARPLFQLSFFWWVLASSSHGLGGRLRPVGFAQVFSKQALTKHTTCSKSSCRHFLLAFWRLLLILAS
jgi:hypothetical protein